MRIGHFEEVNLEHSSSYVKQGVDTAESPQSSLDDSPRGFGLRQIYVDNQLFRSDGFHGFCGLFQVGAAPATSTSAEKLRARRIAVVRPIPWLAPVTMATDFGNWCVLL